MLEGTGKHVEAAGIDDSMIWENLRKTKDVWEMFGIYGKIDSWKTTFLKIKFLSVRRSNTLYPLTLGGYSKKIHFEALGWNFSQFFFIELAKYKQPNTLR